MQVTKTKQQLIAQQHEHIKQTLVLVAEWVQTATAAANSTRESKWDIVYEEIDSIVAALKQIQEW
jgi:hypothetical protein